MITDRIGQHESCYQLIKTMIEFEKETKRRVYIFIKISTFKSAKCETTARAHDAFCHLHRHDVLTVPLTVLIYTLSNYKHDAYTVLLVLKLGW